jgi:hypothetical protein
VSSLAKSARGGTPVVKLSRSQVSPVNCSSVGTVTHMMHTVCLDIHMHMYAVHAASLQYDSLTIFLTHHVHSMPEILA